MILPVSDYEAGKRFYEGALRPLGYVLLLDVLMHVADGRPVPEPEPVKAPAPVRAAPAVHVEPEGATVSDLRSGPSTAGIRPAASAPTAAKEAAPAGPNRDARARRFFAITPQGTSAIEETAALRDRLWRGLRLRRQGERS